MKKRLLALMLTVTMFAAMIAGCGNSKTNETEADTQAQTQEQTKEEVSSDTVMFTDDCGREVEVPADITRIVPSGPLAQIFLFAIAPEKFVGLSNAWYESADGIIADEYRNLTVFGQLYGSADLNVEELAKAEPQLIIDIGEAKSSIVEDMDNLQSQTNIPSVYISASLATTGDAYRKLGKLLGEEERGEELAQFFEKTYDRTMSIMEKVGDNKVKALYITGEEGHNVLANGSFQAEVIDLLFDNLAVVDNPMSKGSGNEVSMEQIAMWNPDFIAFTTESVYATAGDDPTWSQITAIANGNYVEIPKAPDSWLGTPPSSHRYLGMIWLTAVLYPDYCDYDVEAEIKECYRLLYGCELTDEQYDTITANAFIK